MCGIAGLTGQRHQEAVRPMLDTIKHRGPDDTCVWSNDDISLGINRLAVIDVDGPPPPHWNEDSTCCVICNGEIYNYRELKTALQEKGHQFRTNSDTEVIVHLYEEYGEHAPDHLRGMFAFAVYDIPQKRLLLVRDRFGEKPLFYYRKDDVFAFASEVNALLTVPGMERRLNRNALPQFLECAFVKEPETLFEHVYSLPPGHILTFCKGEIISRPYFKLQYAVDEKLQHVKTAAGTFEPIWEQALDRQLVSDVPVGALLSGGLDSSAIVAGMAAKSAAPVKTFHVKLEGASQDESGIARTVARHFGTEHQEITLADRGFDEALFWELLDHTGFPFANASAIPFYLISREVRKQVKVVLSGDGGDECFAGYDYYRNGMKMAFLRSIPGPLRKLLFQSIKGLRQLPDAGESSLLRQMYKALEGASLSPDAFFPWYFGLFTWEATIKLTKIDSQFPSLLPDNSSWRSMSPLRQMMWFSTTYNLPLDMLAKTDRMSMANGLEVRAPFLDKAVFDFAASLPDHLLTNRHQGKLVLREMLKNKLPAEVLAHRKTGFVAPLHRYMNEQFRQMVYELILPDGPLDAVLDKRSVLQYVETGLSQRVDNVHTSVFRSTHRLWLLVQLYAWVRRFKVTV